MAVHAYTSFTFSYLNRARVLAETLKRHHPDWIFWAIITDREPEGFAFRIEDEHFDRAVYADQLYGTDIDSWLFGLDVVEACTAVKGRALKHIMAEPDAETILYFDPDIAIISDLGSIIEALRTASIVLTPHQVDPEPRENRLFIMDNEMASLTYGSFNLGFIGLRNDKEAHRFASWWDDRLTDWCHDRLDIGLFVDQKWCNLVPCFFDDVKVIRDPGCNVASWNISQRPMRTDEEGRLLVKDVPLKFYHFTKLGQMADTMTRRHAGDSVDVYELWWWYSQRVAALTDHAIPARWWHYGTFDNGVPIPRIARDLYRSRDDLQGLYPRPFETQGGYYDWLVKHGHLVAAV